MKPYTLFIKFYSPCVFYNLPTLDAIISFCIAHEKLKEDGYIGFFQISNDVKDNRYGPDKLDKVIKHIGGGYGVPCASFMHPLNEPIDFIESWKKRFDSKYAFYADFGNGKRRIDTASGQYRSYNMPLPAKFITSCWFAFIGDGAEVVRLIDNELVGVAKKVSEGFGWIDSMEIHPAEWTWQEICRMRPFPIKFAEQDAYNLGDYPYKKSNIGWKPPYWLNRNIDICQIPL